MGCCSTKRLPKSPSQSTRNQPIPPAPPPSTNSTGNRRTRGRERCWVLSKICAIFCYIVRRCFCPKSSAKIKPAVEVEVQSPPGEPHTISGESETSERVNDPLRVKVNFQDAENVQEASQISSPRAHSSVPQQKVTAEEEEETNIPRRKMFYWQCVFGFVSDPGSSSWDTAAVGHGPPLVLQRSND